MHCAMVAGNDRTVSGFNTSPCIPALYTTYVYV